MEMGGGIFRSLQSRPPTIWCQRALYKCIHQQKQKIKYRKNGKERPNSKPFKSGRHFHESKVNTETQGE